MFEMPDVRRDDGKVVNDGGRRNGGVLEAGTGAGADRAVEQPAGFESGG